MEERGQSNSTGQHKLILQNRKSGSFTGVTDVVNFDANEIILDTELGRLTIKGKRTSRKPALTCRKKKWKLMEPWICFNIPEHLAGVSLESGSVKWKRAGFLYIFFCLG